jgi:hypothetical protein
VSNSQCMAGVEVPRLLFVRLTLNVWQVSRFQSNFLQRWWDEEEESDDDDDLFFVGAILEGLKRKKRHKKFRGSLSGRVRRDILGGHDRIHLDYFSDKPVYNAKHFKRRFRMLKTLFLQRVAAVESHDEYFRQKPNAAGVLGASPIQKIVGAFCMLAYGISADFLDDYVKMGESTIIESLKHFVKAIIDFFGDKYLRAPNAQDGHEQRKRISRHARFHRLYALEMEQVPNNLERGIHRA